MKNITVLKSTQKVQNKKYVLIKLKFIKTII